jgi:hypothetical protein
LVESSISKRGGSVVVQTIDAIGEGNASIQNEEVRRLTNGGARYEEFVARIPG